MTRRSVSSLYAVCVLSVFGCVPPAPDPQQLTMLSLTATTSYQTVPAGKSPMDSTQRSGPMTITVAAMVRDYDDSWRPSTALVRLWPANAQGDSVAADRRVYDRAAWTLNYQDRGFDVYVWAAFPDSLGIARFPRLPDLPFYVGTAPRALGYDGLAIKPVVVRVDPDTFVVMEAR